MQLTSTKDAFRSALCIAPLPEVVTATEKLVASGLETHSVDLVLP